MKRTIVWMTVSALLRLSTVAWADDLRITLDKT